MRGIWWLGWIVSNRGRQPIALDGEVRQAYKYYVVSCGTRFVKIRDNLLLLLFIQDISWQASEPYCFQGVSTTRNIMHVLLSRSDCQMPRKFWLYCLIFHAENRSITMRFLKVIFSWHEVLFEISLGRFSHQPVNLYAGGYLMRKHLKLYMLCSW